MRNNPKSELIMPANDSQREPDGHANINSGPEQLMQKVTFAAVNQPDPLDKIVIVSDQLIKLFGSDACVVVQRQIEAAGGGDEAATWNAIWNRLCGSQAHPA